MMRIALVALSDEIAAGEPDLEGALASALDATVLHFRDLAQVRSSPSATDVDAVVVRCGAQTTAPGALVNESRALWRDVPLIVLSTADANQTALAATRPRVEGWIAEDKRCELRVAAAVSRAVEQNLRRRQLKALNAIASVVNRFLDMSHTLDTALDQVLHALRVEVCGIHLLEGSPPLLRLRACRGLSDDLVRAAADLRVGEGFSRSIVTSDRPLLVDDIAADAQPLSQSLAKEGVRFFAGVPLHAGGHTIGTLWVLSRSSPIHLDPVPFLATAGNQAATTIENARLYQEANAGRRQWQDTFDAIDDAISIHDSDYTIVRANRAFLHLVGRAAHQVIGAKCYDLVHGTSAPPENCACPRLQRGEAADKMEVQPPGTERQLVLATYPLRDAHGGLDGVVHVFHDVTEERLLHDQVAQADKLTAIGELLAGVAHELNNPLTTVGGLADLLQRNAHALPSEVGDDLSAISQEAARAVRIVQNLLAFSRRTPVAVEPVDLRDCLQRALELFEYHFRVDDIRVETDLPADLPWVSGECDRLQQVIVNLFSNARHALAEVGGGVLSVRAAAEGETVRLEIADTGCGIAEEHLDHVFDPFFTTKAVGEGTGLGLAICRGIIATHGGRIEVANRPGGGVLVAVELPRAVQPERASLAPQPPAPPAARGRVLVVDDEPMVRRFMLRTLETAGHDPAGAENAETALDLLRSQAFDLVLCDLKMPGVGGQGLYRTLLDERADLAGRIVFCTGDTARPAMQAFLNGVSAPWLAKPFTSQQLLKVVDHALEHQREPHNGTPP